MILLKLLIHMTLASPTLLLSIFKTTISTATYLDRKSQDILDSLFWEITTWILYIFAPLLWVLIICGAEIVQGALFTPKYAWELFWHPDGRSLWRMLSDPEGNFERMGDCDKARHKSHMHTERRKWRRGWRKLKLDKSHRTTPTSLIDKGPPGRIVGYDSRLCMFSYYQMDRNNINKCQQGGQRGDDNSIPDATESAMIFTEYYASTYFSASKIFWLKIPKEPPKGFCSSFLVLLATISILLSMTTIAAVRLSRMKPKRRRHRVRKRSAKAIARIRLRKIEHKSRQLYLCKISQDN